MHLSNCRKFPLCSLSLIVSLVVLTHEILSSCTPAVQLSTPPDNYKGPIAERPTIQKGDYWIYQRPNVTKFKTGSLYPNLDFPLWIGKKWSFPGGAVPVGTPQTSKIPRWPTNNDCYVVGFEQLTVAAGTFAAFKCECDCNLIAGVGYEPGCGQWKLWYAPDVKNVIRAETESTATTGELIEYKISRPSAKTSPSKASQSPTRPKSS